jgi:hypothetical protein
VGDDFYLDVGFPIYVLKTVPPDELWVIGPPLEKGEPSQIAKLVNVGEPPRPRVREWVPAPPWTGRTYPG